MVQPIGAMVDASIIMVENAHQRLEEWEHAGRPGSRLEVIIEAAKEVGPSLFFALLVITVGFLPVFTLQAQAGRMFKPLAYTKTYGMLFASFLAITLTPVLMTLFIRGKIRSEGENPIVKAVNKVYRPRVAFSLRYSWQVIIAALVIVVITAVIFLLPMFGPTVIPGSEARFGVHAAAGRRDALLHAHHRPGAGTIAGATNGFIVTTLRVNPTIATLGTLAAFAGDAFLLAPDGKPIGVLTQPDFTWLAQGRFWTEASIAQLGGSKWTGIPVLTVILIVVAILAHILMTYTDFGRASYAIGGNATAARLAGINLSRIRVLMYMISGGIAGLAGVLLTARTTSGNLINGTGLELQAITAVFLGGAATSGGKGTIMGTFLAVILVGVLNNGMNLLGFNTFTQRVALGLLLIAAVAISQWRQAQSERARKRVER